MSYMRETLRRIYDVCIEIADCRNEKRASVERPYLNFELKAERFGTTPEYEAFRKAEEKALRTEHALEIEDWAQVVEEVEDQINYLAFVIDLAQQHLALGEHLRTYGQGAEAKGSQSAPVEVEVLE